MNPLAMILLSVTGLMGVYLFVLYGDQHEQKQQEAVIHHRLESEKFDKDFRDAWNGQALAPDPDQAQRVKKLELRAGEIETRRKAAEAETRRASEDIKKGIEEMAK